MYIRKKKTKLYLCVCVSYVDLSICIYQHVHKFIMLILLVGRTVRPVPRSTPGAPTTVVSSKSQTFNLRAVRNTERRMVQWSLKMAIPEKNEDI